MMRATKPRQPLVIMVAIAEHFLSQAEDYDERVDSAVEAGADEHELRTLLDLASVSRLRALTAATAAAPYCSPRLAAVEVAPMSVETQSRFQSRIDSMSEDEITGYLKAVTKGLLTIEHADAGLPPPGDANDLDLTMGDVRIG
jgi:hypothetical protein